MRFVTLPDLALPSNALGYSTAAIMVLITIASLWFGVTKKRVPQMFAVVYGLVAIVALLGWLAAGADVPVGFLLGNTLVLALPIILGGMGGIMSERVGVVNIAIEGQLLTGAFLAAVIGSITGSLWAGVIAAMIGAALLSTILASLSIKYLVDQIIIGVLLNVSCNRCDQLLVFAGHHSEQRWPQLSGHLQPHRDSDLEPVADYR
jgi:general nucleoside transport system permease protein